jgi:hypothetical protein
MRKRPSKRRVWTRFKRGDWVDEIDMFRYLLDIRAKGVPVEFHQFQNKVRRKRGR